MYTQGWIWLRMNIETSWQINSFPHSDWDSRLLLAFSCSSAVLPSWQAWGRSFSFAAWSTPVHVYRKGKTKLLDLWSAAAEYRVTEWKCSVFLCVSSDKAIYSLVLPECSIQPLHPLYALSHVSYMTPPVSAYISCAATCQMSPVKMAGQVSPSQPPVFTLHFPTFHLVGSLGYLALLCPSIRHKPTDLLESRLLVHLWREEVLKLQSGVVSQCNSMKAVGAVAKIPLPLVSSLSF